jgi:hypothetical protein
VLSSFPVPAALFISSVLVFIIGFYYIITPSFINLYVVPAAQHLRPHPARADSRSRLGVSALVGDPTELAAVGKVDP